MQKAIRLIVVPFLALWASVCVMARQSKSSYNELYLDIGGEYFSRQASTATTPTVDCAVLRADTTWCYAPGNPPKGAGCAEKTLERYWGAVSGRDYGPCAICRSMPSTSQFLATSEVIVTSPPFSSAPVCAPERTRSRQLQNRSYYHRVPRRSASLSRASSDFGRRWRLDVRVGTCQHRRLGPGYLQQLQEHWRTLPHRDSRDHVLSEKALRNQIARRNVQIESRGLTNDGIFSNLYAGTRFKDRFLQLGGEISIRLPWSVEAPPIAAWCDATDAAPIA